MNRTTCGLIRSCLTQDIKYHVLYETFAMKMREILEKKCNEDAGDSREEISDEEYRVSTASKEETLSLSVEEGTLLLST